jgi:CheY-like chemotaxis protein
VSADQPEIDQAELRAVFAAAARGRLDTLARLVDEGAASSEASLRETHTLRGSARVVGLEEIAGLAAELEAALRDDSREAAGELLGSLRTLVDALPVATSPTATPDMGGPVVLYVEDDRANALVVERILKQRPGLTFLAASTGAEGLRLARERRPVLVLLDMRLPDMRGLDVLERLRADPETAGLEVALITGGVDPDAMNRLEEAGVRDVIGKPFEVRRLLTVVDSVLGKPKTAP